MRYEVVFDCRDRSLGERLRSQLEDAIVEGADDHGYEELVRSEEGPSTWGVTVTFVDDRAADRFFRGEAYRQFCVEVRRMCQAPVYVVPLG